MQVDKLESYENMILEKYDSDRKQYGINAFNLRASSCIEKSLRIIPYNNLLTNTSNTTSLADILMSIAT
jgi:hypothetical protein